MDQQTTPLTEQDALERMDAVRAALPDYPGGFGGCGIVIPAGGERFFTCAWVCVHMLRRLGCRLPVQFWHLGPAEMSEEMRALAAPLGVECVDAREVSRRFPARILNGWELKWFAIAHCRFEQVLLLDADNVPVVDPEFLFESGPYREHGAVFWPDRGRLAPSHPVWRLTGVPYRDEPEFETGQIVVDKARCWGPLRLAGWMNDHSDFWYRHFHGDKETFHIAWRKVGREYAMPPHPLEDRDGVICQHDFSGRRIFQHRSGPKWKLGGPNPWIAGLLYEDECRAGLLDLRRAWQGPVVRHQDARATKAQREAARALCAAGWIYQRPGHDERLMTFGLDGRVMEGAAGCERTWRFDGESLCLFGEGGLTCRLDPAGAARWKGRWLVHQRTPVELIGEVTIDTLCERGRGDTISLASPDRGAHLQEEPPADARGLLSRPDAGLVRLPGVGTPRRLIYAADAGYFDMLRVSIASFLRHNGPARGKCAAGASTSRAREESAGALPGAACSRVRLAGNESDGWKLCVLDVGLTAGQRHILRRMGIEVLIYPVHRVIPGNVGAWARLRMLEDFTSDGELLLYLDADTLVLSSVEPMVDGFLGSEQAIGLATEMIDTEWEPPTMLQAFAERPAPGFGRYENWKDHLVMNTGVLLARGPAAGEIARQCTALYPRICEGAKWAEQSILDAVLLDHGYGWWEIPANQHCLARGDLIEHTGPIHEGGATYRGEKVIVRHFCGARQKETYARDVLPKAREFFGV